MVGEDVADFGIFHERYGQCVPCRRGQGGCGAPTPGGGRCPDYAADRVSLLLELTLAADGVAQVVQLAQPHLPGPSEAEGQDFLQVRQPDLAVGGIAAPGHDDAILPRRQFEQRCGALAQLDPFAVVGVEQFCLADDNEWQGTVNVLLPQIRHDRILRVTREERVVDHHKYRGRGHHRLAHEGLPLLVRRAGGLVPGQEQEAMASLAEQGRRHSEAEGHPLSGKTA